MFRRNEPLEQVPPAEPDLSGLVVVGTRTVEVSRGRPYASGGPIPEALEVEVLAEKTNYTKIRAYRYPNGTVELIGEPSGPNDTHTPVGFIRRHDPARTNDKRSDTVLDRFAISESDIALAEKVRPEAVPFGRQILRHGRAT